MNKLSIMIELQFEEKNILTFVFDYDTICTGLVLKNYINTEIKKPIILIFYYLGLRTFIRNLKNQSILMMKQYLQLKK